MTANIDNTTRKAVYRRDHYRCVLCDSTDGLQIHHAIPRGKGGADVIQNLAAVCWRCHFLIHDCKRWHVGDEITSEEAAQLVVEYLADIYAPNWNPWKRGRP